MKRLEDRVAVVTGAGGGVGTALAQAFARAGMHLALVDISADGVERTAKSVADRPVRVSTHTADVTDADAMLRLRDDVLGEHGAVHVLVNNAGITIQKNFATHTLADWDRMIGINVLGVIHGCHVFHETLAAQDEAHVVNLSSMSAFVGLPGQSSYCATKAAVHGLSDSIRAEWHFDGIGVTSIHPGAIQTEMIQATLADSDDVRAAQRNYELAQRTGVPPELVAKRILEAIRRNKTRIRIGRDAHILDWVSRLAPVGIQRLMLKIAAGQRPRPSGAPES